MAHIVYGQNKFICNFVLSEQIKKNQSRFLIVNDLVRFVHHFQYPCVFYQDIYNHFKNHLPKNVTKNHIRIHYNRIELPSDLPIGLYVNQKCKLEISYSQFQIAQPYQIVFNSLKKAFCGVNGVKGCDYILKKISKQEQNQKVKDYFQGRSHNLQHQNFAGYQGSHIMLKIMIKQQVIQRRAQVNSSKIVGELIEEILPQITKAKYKFQSHGMQLNLNMNAKVFLDELSYNDGYCYIKIVERQDLLAK